MDRKIIYLRFKNIKFNTEMFSSLCFNFNDSADDYGCAYDKKDNSTYIERFYDGNRKKRLLEYGDRISRLFREDHYGNAVEEP